MAASRRRPSTFALVGATGKRNVRRRRRGDVWGATSGGRVHMYGARDVRKPSVCRRGRGTMSRSVSAVSMARSEDGRCPPRVPPPTASQVAIAAGATHTVISPRWTSARSSAGQFPTWYFVLYFGCTLDFMSRSGTCCRHDSQEVDRGSPRARDPCTNASRDRCGVSNRA